eukprot:GCRY01004036.1.p1 GENE.GCRY01004036.1~~GCRY01004036.1.p1  ORF type:complete len:948 (-),score=254.42 GCRY01004036.1:6-2849(-)
MNEEVFSLIHYYIREQLHSHVQLICADELSKRGHDVVMHFWHAFGLFRDGRLQEAASELNSLKSKRDVQLACIIVLTRIYQSPQMEDIEMVASLEAEQMMAEETCNEEGLLEASLACFHEGQSEDARKYCTQLLSRSEGNPQVLQRGNIVLGWIDLKGDRPVLVERSIKYFNQALDENSKSLEALMGKAEYLKRLTQKDSVNALDIYNQAYVLYPNYIPALMEKCRLLVVLGDFELALETCHQTLVQDSRNIVALSINLTYLLSHEGRPSTVASRFPDFINILSRDEPYNHQLYVKLAKPLARLACGNQSILVHTMSLVDRAISLDASVAEYHCEKAFQLGLLEKYPEAMAEYKRALECDQGSVDALNGVISCQISLGAFEEAAQQLEFLTEIQASTGKTAELCVLQARLAWEQDHDDEGSIRFLNEGVKLHIHGLDGIAHGPDFFVKLQPDFVVEIALYYLSHHPGSEPIKPAESPSSTLRKALKLLELVVRHTPGHIRALYHLGRAQYIANELQASENAAVSCLKIDPTYAEAHILLAKIYLVQGQHRNASQSLEQGLSYNFKVRETAEYHLVKATIHEEVGDTEQCVKILQEAMRLKGVRREDPNSSAGRKHTVDLYTRVSVFLELSRALTKQGQIHEATKVLSDAISEFSGTPEEARVSIANAELMVAKNDIQGAIDLLRGINAAKRYFVQAKTALANIYLEHKRDQRQYAQCFREIVQGVPSIHTLLLLGNAYLTILEPEKAISVFESALKKNPKDTDLARKIGKAYVTTHDYAKAIKYYENALQSTPDVFAIQEDLATLYLRLRKFDKAKTVLDAAISHLKQGHKGDGITPSRLPASTLLKIGKLQLLLAEMYEMAGQTSHCVQTLMECRSLKTQLLGQLKHDDPEAYRTEELATADICYRLAKKNEEIRNSDKARMFFTEALKYNDGHKPAMEALSRSYL